MSDGAVFGCDFAGTVDVAGKSVSRLSKGDPIAGLIWGGGSSPRNPVDITMD